MKLKFVKRVVILSCVFVLSIVNFIFAKTYDLSQISQVKTVSDYSTDTLIDDMDTVEFGSYPQSDISGNNKEPIEWVVLKKDNYNKTVLLLSKKVLDVVHYKKNEDDNAFWQDSLLRQYLNNDFYDSAFSRDEKTVILDSVVTPDHMYDIEELETIDKIYICSFADYVNYFKVPDERSVVTASGNKSYGEWNNLKCHFTEYAMQKYIDNHDYPGEVTLAEELYRNNSTIWVRTIGVPSTNICTMYSGRGSLNDCFYSPGPNRAANEIGNKDKKTIKFYQNGELTKTSYIIGGNGVRPVLMVGYNVDNVATNDKNFISGLPNRESELRSDNHFYLDNNMQKSTWVYYVTYYYHVDSQGNIEKSKWVEQRYVGADGRMYRGRQTPDGKWVGDDGLVVDVGNDLTTSLTIEAAEPDSWYKTQSGLWYYFENDRTTTKKGWFTDSRDNQTYYLDPQTGIMAVGWTKINGSEYYFNESHDNENNWYETGGGFYESYGKKTKAYGLMFKNETTPDGKKVGADGKLLK